MYKKIQNFSVRGCAQIPPRTVAAEALERLTFENVDTPGRVKTRDWKRRDGRKCTLGKLHTGKGRTTLQGWKTRKKRVWTDKCYFICCCSNTPYRMYVHVYAVHK